MLNLFGTAFGWPGTPSVEQKGARGRLARQSHWLGDTGRQTQLPRGYEALVRESYMHNPVAQRACRLVATAVAGAPVTSDKAAVLALIAGQANGASLLETAAMHLLLHGNAFIQMVSDGSDQPAVVDLFALRPDRVSIDLDNRGWPVAYAYRAGGEVQRLPAVDASGRPCVVHIRQPNPIDDHYGQSCLSAAAQAVAIHNSACRWNHALLDNAARPSGALVHDPRDGTAGLSTAQFERLRDELAAQFQGSGNAGRPLLLEGGLKWQSMSLSPAEMDFQALKDSAARDIAMAFGVPPMLIGLTGDATYANYREASKAFWRQTVLPMLGAILAPLNQAMAGWMDGAGVRVSIDKISALAEDRERHWAQVTAADFLTAEEKRAMLDIAPSHPAGSPGTSADAATTIQQAAC